MLGNTTIEFRKISRKSWVIGFTSCFIRWLFGLTVDDIQKFQRRTWGNGDYFKHFWWLSQANTKNVVFLLSLSAFPYVSLPASLSSLCLHSANSLPLMTQWLQKRSFQRAPGLKAGVGESWGLGCVLCPPVTWTEGRGELPTRRGAQLLWPAPHQALGRREEQRSGPQGRRDSEQARWEMISPVCCRGASFAEIWP